MIFGENHNMSKEEKLGKNRAFAVAKAVSPRLGRGARKTPLGLTKA